MTDISTGKQRGIVPFVDETTGRLPDQYIPQKIIDLQGDLEQAVTNASASATAAKASETAAKASETDADSSAQAAAASAESAQTATESAASSKDAAARSASEASASAQAAETSKTNAANSATAAKASETNAASSASAAASSETNAATSATAAQNAVDGFGLEVGATTTGEPGTDASVNITKQGTKYVADFTIPRGEQGPQGSSGDAASLETALTSGGVLVYEADWLTGSPSTSPSSATNISSVSIPLLADGAAGANLVRVDLDALTDTSLAVAWDNPDSSDTVDGLLARARVVPVKAGLDQTIDIRIPTMPESGNPKRRLRIFLPNYMSMGQVRFHVWAEPPAEATVFDLDSTPGFAAAHNGTILDAADGKWTEYIPAIRLGRVTGLAMRRGSSASPLSSARMLFLGDSWCAGSGDGYGGWATLIKATYPDATVINKGHYGADWLQAAGYHCPFDGGEPSDPLPDATDYLVVQAYTNGLYQASSEQNGVVTDGKSGLPLGTPSTDHWKGIDGLNASYPQDSHCRRADWVLGSLARKYAGKGTRLLLIAPYRAPSQDGENNAYRLLLPSIFAIARKWGYQILDNFTSSPIPYWDRTLAEPYMWHRTANDNGGEGVDDTHLGLAGNKRVTPAIVAALEQL